MSDFDGLGLHLGNLWRLSPAQTRSISPENPTGAKAGGARATAGTGANAARELGEGWKISPSVKIGPGDTHVMADINGSGAIQHIWLTPTGRWRNGILRVYWDWQEHPSIEVPVGDFFCCGWGQYAQVSSLAVCVNPGSAFNCYWEMPFKHNARITWTNTADDEMTLYYQITYTETHVPEDAAYLHAQFRRSNPVARGDVHTIIDDVSGCGQYVGTYLAWGVNAGGWWGEGEVKHYIDGDTDYPTICGTGTEDYFGGSYNFEAPDADGHRTYKEFTTPYSGLPQVLRPDGRYRSQTRFGMYRWHITDPIRFQEDLRVTVQDLGWRKDGRYLQRQDDIASTAFWYQTLPSLQLYPLPGRDELEVI